MNQITLNFYYNLKKIILKKIIYNYIWISTAYVAEEKQKI